jgi:hypothetical protein
MAGMSILERCIVIRRSGTPIKPHQLRLLYYSQKITNQKTQCAVGNPKNVSPAVQEAALLKIKIEIQEARDAGWVIFQGDESMFSEKSFKQRTWARVRQPQLRNKKGCNNHYICVFATISEETGTGTIYEKERAFDQFDFMAILRQFRRDHADIPKLGLFLDNCSIHRTLFVQNEAANLGIRLFYNAAYRPDLMGV